MPAKEKNLTDLFLHTLKDVLYAEKQILKALPKMAKAAESEELKEAFETHREETQGQIERLEKVFEILGKPARGVQCEAINGIIEEGKEVMEDFAESAACAPPSPTEIYRRVHRSVVRVERTGRQLHVQFGVLSLQETEGEGAGFVWKTSGQVLTAAHVVNGATRVWLRYFDGRRVPGRVLYSNPAAEVAVLVPAGAWPAGLETSRGRRTNRGESYAPSPVLNPCQISHFLTPPSRRYSGRWR